MNHDTLPIYTKIFVNKGFFNKTIVINPTKHIPPIRNNNEHKPTNKFNPLRRNISFMFITNKGAKRTNKITKT